MSGPIGELIFWYISGQKVMMASQIAVTAVLTVSLPSTLKMPPIPLVKAKVAVCLRINKNPFTAAVQKFSPVRAI
jgi:hypothetical protein